MGGFCILVSVALIVVQFGDIFVPEIMLGIIHSNPLHALQKIFWGAHKLDAREPASSKEHYDHLRLEAPVDASIEQMRSQKQGTDNSQNYFNLDQKDCNPSREPIWEFEDYSGI